MTWLTPLVGGIVLLSIIPPLVALYFLRLKRSQRLIPSTLLWKRATEDIRANSPFQRLRSSLLLWVQILIIVLIGLALMQPQIDAGRRTGGKTVLLIDNSSSMNSVDTEEKVTRLDEAKRLAKERIEELHGGGMFGGLPGEVMVIAFNENPEVRTPFTDSRSQAIAAIDSIMPSDARSLIGPALELSRAYATVVDPENMDRSMIESAALELYSDGRVGDLSENVLQGGEVIDYRMVGELDSSNVSIRALAADRPYDKPGMVQVFATFQNSGDESVSAFVQLSIDGGVRSITPEPIDIPAAGVVGDEWVPGGRQLAFAPFEMERGAVIEVEILYEDSHMTDNVGALILPPARKLKVALVGRNSFEVAELLKSLSLSSLDVLSPDDFMSMANTDSYDRYDLFVLVDAALDNLPPGRYLSFGKTPPVDDLSEFGDPVEGAIVIRSKDEHPVLRYVNLDGLFVNSLNKVVLSGTAKSLAEGAAGPMIMEIDRGDLQMIHVAFDPLDSNWPIERSWANFVANAVEYLGSLTDAIAQSGRSPGETFQVQIPQNALDLKMTLSDGQVFTVDSPSSGMLSWGPARTAGLYELSWSLPGGTEREKKLFAVNQMDPDEARIAAVRDITFGIEDIQGRVSGTGVQWSGLWPWLLGVVLALSMVEWWLWQRQAGTG